MKEEIVKIKTSELVPYVNNARVHSDEQISKIQASIREFGLMRPVLCFSDKTIMSGHAVVLACKKEGIEEIPCLICDNLSKTQMKAYILADNRLAELSSWDEELLKINLQELNEMEFDISVTGFDFEDFEIEDQIEKEDSFNFDKPAPKVAQPGDIFILGNHRVMCGNSQSMEELDLLLGGENVDLLLTDPPYNVDYENYRGDKIKNDKMPEDDYVSFLTNCFQNAANLVKKGGSFYLFYGASKALSVLTAIEKTDLMVKQVLIWYKNHFVLGRQDYQWDYEPCLYGWKKGDKHYFVNDRTETTVIEEDKPQQSQLHPTMKPVELFSRFIENSSRKGEKVLDIFGGSGTTIIACEMLGRRGFVMDENPDCVDVMIARWEEATGQKALKI